MVGPPKKKVKKANLSERRLIIILEQASLETAKMGKKYELLSSDKHRSFLLKQGKDPGDYRPDITHQCLLMLLDSPLNRAGLLQVLIHTTANVLIQVSPQTRIPRTFDRFAGLMVELLHKLSIKAKDGSEKLLKVIKNPVSDHLPVGCRKVLRRGCPSRVRIGPYVCCAMDWIETMQIGTSFHAAGGLIDARELVPAENEETGAVAIVVGALARGQVKTDYTEEEVKLSNYPLSAALTCTKICTAFEDRWNVERLPTQS